MYACTGPQKMQIGKNTISWAPHPEFTEKKETGTSHKSFQAQTILHTQAPKVVHIHMVIFFSVYILSKHHHHHEYLMWEIFICTMSSIFTKTKISICPLNSFFYFFIYLLFTSVWPYKGKGNWNWDCKVYSNLFRSRVSNISHTVRQQRRKWKH